MERARAAQKKLIATAYHEAGHAVASHVLKYAPKTKKLTIEPEPEFGNLGHALAFFMPSLKPDLEDDLKTMARLEARVIVLLAGPESERKYTGRYNNAGAAGDHADAADYALRMDSNSTCMAAHREYCRQRAIQLVDHQWKMIEKLAEALLEHKTLNGKQVRAILDESHALAQSRANAAN